MRNRKREANRKIRGGAWITRIGDNSAVVENGKKNGGKMLVKFQCRVVQADEGFAKSKKKEGRTWMERGRRKKTLVPAVTCKR